jgi:hypothetical protein
MRQAGAGDELYPNPRLQLLIAASAFGKSFSIPFALFVDELLIEGCG